MSLTAVSPPYKIFKFIPLIFSLFCYNTYSQAVYEEGYLITYDGVFVEGAIKDLGWFNNPDQFEIIVSPEGSPEVKTVAEVKEFGVPGKFKYISSVVGIDRSKESLSNLNSDRNPDLKEEKLFLKVLLEGEASLYAYKDQSIEKYFFSVRNSEIEPLIYKRFLTNSNKIGANNFFRQQLMNSFECPSFSDRTYTGLKYKEKDFLEIFKKYNSCVGSEITDYDKMKPEGSIYFGIKGGVISRSKSLRDFTHVEDIGPAFNFQAGLSLEYILPILRNKWSFFFEPSYYQFKGEGEGLLPWIGPVPSNPGGSGRPKVDLELNISALSLPAGIRHHLFLNSNSRIFINGGLVYDFIFDGANTVPSANNEFEHEAMLGYLLGLGYSLNNKYSLELRYISGNTALNDTSYNDTSFSLLLGYNLFEK